MLTVITPCTRPWNLPALKASLPAAFQWVVVLDGPKRGDVPLSVLQDPRVEVHEQRGGIWGNVQRNFGLSQAKGDCVYFLDDDNVIHPRLSTLIEEHPERAVVTNQIYSNGTRRLIASGQVRRGYIDTAQVALPRNLAQAYQWAPDLYDADGVYFSEIYRNHPHRFTFVNEDASYYNFLRPMPCYFGAA